ncbi:PREDICTED: graves disease carrier protein-like [Priapulus caudatus]|uniref:Graves disease carrier protein-like n=1 Tax=Priapulus caudatus TaxID=37621 RepID=A0ABM1F2X1_PRICU|nr:PREDICTED: graves disease carrier protein-like [Priapulus caudatus]
MAAPSETKGLEFIARSFIAGGVSGMCAKTSIAPLDRVKILLQAHNVHYKHLGVVRTLKHIVIKENFLALYKSNGAQMVRIFPYAAVQFMSYEQYKKIMTQFFGQHSHISKMIAGSCAGVSAVTVTYPLDMVRARLAFQVTGEHVYTGISHTLRSIVTKEGGVRALYRGFSPTILGMIPYAGTRWTLLGDGCSWQR